MAHVLIVGAGPAGASLAVVLAQRGITVTLLERQHDFAREFRGEVLMPSGIEALEQMGLAPLLRTVPHHPLLSIAAFMNGRPLVGREFDAADFRGRPPLAVSQPALLEGLVEAAVRSGRVEFARGVSVRELVSEGGRVVGVHAHGAAGARTVRGDLVVGADGRASAVRKHSGIAVRAVDPPMDVVWCKVPLPAGWPDARAYAGRGHLLLAYHTWDDSLQLGWVILKGTFGELRERGIARWVEEMARHVPPDFADHLRRHTGAVERPFLLDTQSSCAQRWSRPGLLLIGDAAHTMSPVGGQGLNVAVRDAIVAANHLVPVLAGPAPAPERVDAALRAIEAERMAEVRVIQRLQAQPPRVILSHAWWGEPARALVGALLRSPFVQRRLAAPGGPVSDFAFGVTDVQLRV